MRLKILEFNQAVRQPARGGQEGRAPCEQCCQNVRPLPKRWRPRAAAWVLIGLAAAAGHAQDLTPRAYLVTPVGSNAVILTWSFFDGDVSTDPSTPITDSAVRFNLPLLSFYHSFGFFGRSANVAASLPYAFGTFRGKVAGAEGQAYRSGLADARVRVSVNILGGRAMPLKEFRAWHEKTVLGASLTVAVPTGQYDPARVINPGLHRWGLRPEIGSSRRWGPWTVDLYGGVSFFTVNRQYYPGGSARTQAPIGYGELHLSYHFKPSCWMSLDGNFWTAGRSSINGIEKSDYQRNSRIGATAAIPLNRHQSLKVSYSRGAYISIGGNYHNVSVAWQYSWVRGAE